MCEFQHIRWWDRAENGFLTIERMLRHGEQNLLPVFGGGTFNQREEVNWDWSPHNAICVHDGVLVHSTNQYITNLTVSLTTSLADERERSNQLSTLAGNPLEVPNKLVSCIGGISVEQRLEVTLGLVYEEWINFAGAHVRFIEVWSHLVAGASTNNRRAITTHTALKEN